MVEEQPESQGTVCATRTREDIQNLLAICQRHRLMGAIVGDPGTGKTTAVIDYVDRQPSFEVSYFKVSKAAASMRHFMVQLHEGLAGRVPKDAGTNEIYSSLADALYRQSRREGLLILDEVQDLELEAKDVIRNLYEDTELGICLVGNKDLFVQRSRKGSQSFNRFVGRIGPKIKLDKPLPEDIEALCDFHQVTGKGARKLVAKIATTGQQLHDVKNVFKVAREAIAQTGDLSEEILRRAAFLTGVSV